MNDPSQPRVDDASKSPSAATAPTGAAAAAPPTNRLLADLQWRGLVHQSTDLDHLRAHLSQPRWVYAGFDPTASSLHVGSLLPLMMLRRFQRAGHRPIALVGGATGMIGDPSGKRQERQLLDREQLSANVAGLTEQIGRFLDLGGERGGSVVNNLDWLGPYGVLDFLRDVGKHVPVGTMLAKESVKLRLGDEVGLSYTEFSYMLLQAYDFVHLARQHGCTLQLGGSDQWGNITAGIDLGRRLLGASLFGLTCPLLTTSDGRKMGKTEAGTVWLSAERTSAYQFYQYFMNVADADVLMALRFLTELDREQIEQLETSLLEAPQRREAQRALAAWLTRLVHGETGLEAAQRATEILFGAEIERLSQAELDAIFSDVPSCSLDRSRLADQTLGLIDLLVQVELAKSKSDARRQISQGSIWLNNRRMTDPERLMTTEDLVTSDALVLRSGKKRYALARFVG
jgi:tyrosyl-tRNA synthetase